MPEEHSRSARIRTTAFVVWTAVGALLLVAAAIWLVGRIMPAIVPFIVGGVIAFLLHGPVNYLEGRGAPRALAVVLCFLLGISVLVVAGLFLAPPVARQIQEFSEAVPTYLARVQEFVTTLQDTYSAVLIPTWVRNAVSAGANDIGRLASSIAESAGTIIVIAGTGVVTALVDLLLALVIAFWILKDLPTMRREVDRLAGPRFEADAEVLVSTVNRVVGGYLKGQTIASLVTGTVATIGLAIIGVPYALVLGIITFFFNYIPYVGPIVAGLIAATVGLFVSPLTAILAIVVVLLAQNLTDNLVTPKVMSDQVNLHPTLVIFSLLVGATIAGIPGMLFAIPFAAVVQGLFVYYYERRTRRQLTSETGALFKVATCPPDEEPCDEDARTSADEAAPTE